MRIVVLMVVMLGALAAFAPPAIACNEVQHSSARRHPAGSGRAPLAIGDSTMILAAPKLARLGIEADAHGCRQFATGIEMLSQRKRAGTLPAVVVLALGANGPIGPGQLSTVLRILGRDRILVLVTPKVIAVSRARMLAIARAHPDRVLLIDWAVYSGGHSSWFDGDGLHPGDAGAGVYARLIRRRIAGVAFPPVRRLKVPRRARGARACGSVRRGGLRYRVYIVRGADRVVCRRARELARRPPLRPGTKWRSYDWRRVPRAVWAWMYRRHDGRVVVGVVGRPRR